MQKKPPLYSKTYDFALVGNEQDSNVISLDVIMTHIWSGMAQRRGLAANL